MRKVIDEQMKLGEVEISKIVIDLNSRDETPQLLLGLQHIYRNLPLRDKAFAILGEHIKDSGTGRPGMDLWKILVLGTLRLNCDCDYDRLKEMADNHINVREMLGHTPWTCRDKYPLQTLKDNVGLLTPALLDEVNKLVVEAGHAVIGKTGEPIKARCDSFVVETNVHFPTDINLLFDAVRKSVELCARLCDHLGIPGWRQSEHLLDKLRRQMLYCARLKHNASKNAQDGKKTARREAQALKVKEAYASYLAQAELLLARVDAAVVEATRSGCVDKEETIAKVPVIERFADDARHQVDLVRRRVLEGEAIPHADKFFSVFKKETEWICKGKAGKPQELGIRVGLVEDQYGFILSHLVMENTVDSKAAVALVTAAKKDFPTLHSCSFDQGFWAPDVFIELQKILSVVAVKKKGKLSKDDRKREESDEFRKARRGHSAVESAINALGNHGLDRCPDCGIDAFKRYVAMGVLARNIQKLGALIQKKELERIKRSKAAKEAWERRKMLDPAA